MQIQQINCSIEIKKIDIGYEEAIKLHETKFWRGWTPEEIARFQMYNSRLLVPWDVFQDAVSETLGRPVWTHEFASDELREELKGKRPQATFDGVLGLLPPERTIVVIV